MARSKSIKRKDSLNDSHSLLRSRLIQSSDIPPEKRKLTAWQIFSLILTFLIPNAFLKCAGMKDQQSRQAFREKLALCFIILVISCIVGFFSLFLNDLLCPKSVTDIPKSSYATFGASKDSVSIYGKVYSISSLKGIANMPTDLIPGRDYSLFVSRDMSACTNLPTSNGSSFKYVCDPKCVPESSLPAPENILYYQWSDIKKGVNQSYIVFNGDVLLMTDYFATPILANGNNVLQSQIGNDATSVIMKMQDGKKIGDCFTSLYEVGLVDYETPGCFTAEIVMIIGMCIILGLILIKFFMAVIFDWFMSHQKESASAIRPPVVLLVTCYSEGYESLKGTLDSLCETTYRDENKLLFVVADGLITGHGETRSTPDILLGMMQLEPLESNPVSYNAVGEGSRAFNMAKVYAGYYVSGHHKTPMVLIVKCGDESEKVKPGNRGKRDSQLILMRFFQRVFHNDLMTGLDFDLFEKIRRITYFSADKYEIVLMVDADTRVSPDSVTRMIAAMQNDPKIMGLCGETQIHNKAASWVTAIQVFEYYINHHLGKAFESVFGGVTCLPGCFCMYRLKAIKNETWAPILASPTVINEYSESVVETLHEKNLLLLGEDRFLTTLMLRTFPKRKLIFVPKATCQTVVPDEFPVLLSQRRRWINSTIHNLLELLLVGDLCGTFCFSMQFVVFLELVGTVSLPAAFGFMIYLIVKSVLTGFHGIASMVPLLILAASFALPVVLIFISSRNFSYILWMLVYIIALPIWNVVLPLYSFWRFDDFSWGQTRKVQGEDVDTHGMTEQVTRKVTMQTWATWKRETE